MMRILIKTPVAQAAPQVFQGFTQELFMKLAPPFPRLKLLRYEGNQVGNRVLIRLNFLLFQQTWESLIVEQGQNENEYYFVDEGVQLPFFLKKVRHRHSIVPDGQGSVIIDDFRFNTPNRLLDYLMYPGLYLQFWIRKPVYRKIFA